MNRRGRGEGSIYFDRERSKWVGVLDLTEPGGKRVRPKVSAPTKTVAREKLAALRKELEDVSLAAPRVTAVAAVVADWLDNLPRDIKDSGSVQLVRGHGARITRELARSRYASLRLAMSSGCCAGWPMTACPPPPSSRCAGSCRGR
jgi:hypothetical protein